MQGSATSVIGSTLRVSEPDVNEKGMSAANANAVPKPRCHPDESGQLLVFPDTAGGSKVRSLRHAKLSERQECQECQDGQARIP